MKDRCKAEFESANWRSAAVPLGLRGRDPVFEQPHFSALTHPVRRPSRRKLSFQANAIYAALLHRSNNLCFDDRRSRTP